jgi:hypothetical protein
MAREPGAKRNILMRKGLRRMVIWQKAQGRIMDAHWGSALEGVVKWKGDGFLGLDSMLIKKMRMLMGTSVQ